MKNQIYSKEQILKLVSSYGVFNYYLRGKHNYGKVLPLKKLFSNPFQERVQQTPSCNIYKPEGAKEPKLHDYATGDSCDCFETVMRLFDLSFPEALKKITKDMDSIYEYNTGVDEPQEFGYEAIHEKSDKSFDIIPRRYKQSEIDYWLRYGITQKIRRKYNVKAVLKYTATSRSGEQYTVSSSSNNPIFAYDFGDYVKIYRPLAEKSRRFIYLGVKPKDYVFGYDQLPDEGDLVIITAGEKDTMSLAAHGFNAISLNSESAIPGNKLIDDLSSRFKKVVFLYDNDETGRKKSESIAREYNLPRVDLPKIENGGKDISDFFLEGGDKDMVNDLINEAIDYLKDSPPPVKDFVTGLELLSMQDDNTPLLWDPFFKRTGLVSLIGSSDSGKSTFCRQLCISIATKQVEFLGHSLYPKCNRVYFVSSEDDMEATSMLLKKQLKGKTFPEELYKNLVFTFECENVIERLDEQLTEKPASLIVIDSFADFLNGKDINANSQVRSILKQYSELAKKHGCLILLIHHVGKRTEGVGPSKHNAIGSQAFEAKMRVVLDLSTDDEDRKHLSVVKGNYLSKEMKKASYVLDFDEDTLTFSMTDERVDFSELSGKEKKEKYEIDWVAIFDGADELKLGEICNRLNKTLGMPRGSAQTYISKYLVPGSKYGYWRIPDSKNGE